jgi:hypothetical protein
LSIAILLGTNLGSASDVYDCDANLYWAGLIVAGYQVFCTFRDIVCFVLICVYPKKVYRSHLIRLAFFVILDSTVLLGLLVWSSGDVLDRGKTLKCKHDMTAINVWKNFCIGYYLYYWMIAAVAFLIFLVYLATVCDSFNESCAEHGFRGMWSWDLFFENGGWNQDEDIDINLEARPTRRKSRRKVFVQQMVYGGKSKEAKEINECVICCE